MFRNYFLLVYIVIYSIGYVLILFIIVMLIIIVVCLKGIYWFDYVIEKV